MKPIVEVAAQLGVPEGTESYGKYKQIDYNLLNNLGQKPDGKVILVTAINPTRREKKDNLRSDWEMH